MWIGGVGVGGVGGVIIDFFWGVSLCKCGPWLPLLA